ncbi:unnamed protein product [Protopolystoma xenopodis]|uniref:Uncharacterized protein n=1 Tax=Protopolystoma xenopodis TaxID=117903 RepID=A0A448XFB9_9PLAT|nr:unnamed protein product [Protopolystoma xenopodis]
MGVANVIIEIKPYNDNKTRPTLIDACSVIGRLPHDFAPFNCYPVSNWRGKICFDHQHKLVYMAVSLGHEAYPNRQIWLDASIQLN